MPIESRKEGLTSSELRSMIESYGGKCVKVDSDVGIPDRLCILPNWAFMVEVKQQGEVPRPNQQKQIDELNRLGFDAFAIAGKAELLEFEKTYLTHFHKKEKSGGRLLDYPD